MPGGCGAVDERGNKNVWAFIPVDCYRRQVSRAGIRAGMAGLSEASAGAQQFEDDNTYSR